MSAEYARKASETGGQLTLDPNGEPLNSGPMQLSTCRSAPPLGTVPLPPGAVALGLGPTLVASSSDKVGAPGAPGAGDVGAPAAGESSSEKDACMSPDVFQSSGTEEPNPFKLDRDRVPGAGGPGGGGPPLDTETTLPIPSVGGGLIPGNNGAGAGPVPPPSSAASSSVGHGKQNSSSSRASEQTAGKGGTTHDYYQQNFVPERTRPNFFSQTANSMIHFCAKANIVGKDSYGGKESWGGKYGPGGKGGPGGKYGEGKYGGGKYGGGGGAHGAGGPHAAGAGGGVPAGPPGPGNWAGSSSNKLLTLLNGGDLDSHLAESVQNNSELRKAASLLGINDMESLSRICRSRMSAGNTCTKIVPRIFLRPKVVPRRLLKLLRF